MGYPTALPMRIAFLSTSRRRRWLHRLGRTLAMVVQLAMIFTPLAEGREERVLGAHVEAPRTIPHPGHRPDSCPACQLLSVHGRTESRSELGEVPQASTRCGAQKVTFVVGVELSASNCSRAPPISL
ncbi:MAG: hypothetical protein ABJE10_20065 [bacterium]